MASGVKSCGSGCWNVTTFVLGGVAIASISAVAIGILALRGMPFTAGSLVMQHPIALGLTIGGAVIGAASLVFFAVGCCKSCCSKPEGKVLPKRPE